MGDQDGHNTIAGNDEQADSAVDRRYLQLSSALVDATKLDQLPKAEPLIEGVLSCDSLNWQTGKPGHGKSLLALDMGCCIATGYPWRGHPVTPGNVLYILAEGSHGMDERLQAWEHVNGRQVPAGRLTFLPVAVQLHKDIDVAAVTQLAEELGPPVFIIIDTQARCTVGAEENSSRDMGQFIDSLDRLRIATRACLLIVHHEARTGDNPRGSSALEGAATTLIRLTRDGMIVTLECKKQKDGPEFPPINAKLERVQLPGSSSLAYCHEPVAVSDLTGEAETHVLAALRQSFDSTGASASTLLKVSGLTDRTFYRALKALVTKGLIVNTGTQHRTRYVLAGYQEQL